MSCSFDRIHPISLRRPQPVGMGCALVSALARQQPDLHIQLEEPPPSSAPSEPTGLAHASSLALLPAALRSQSGEHPQRKPTPQARKHQN